MTPAERGFPREFEDLSLTAESTGTADDDDDRDDEHHGENEIPVRETDETTEAPEEFEIDDQDEPGTRDGDADGLDDEDDVGFVGVDDISD